MRRVYETFRIATLTFAALWALAACGGLSPTEVGTGSAPLCGMAPMSPAEMDLPGCEVGLPVGIDPALAVTDPHPDHPDLVVVRIGPVLHCVDTEEGAARVMDEAGREESARADQSANPGDPATGDGSGDEGGVDPDKEGGQPKHMVDAKELSSDGKARIADDPIPIIRTLNAL